MQEVRRHNLWQRCLDLSKAVDEEEVLMGGIDVTGLEGAPRRRTAKSALTSLNLSHNHLHKTPECLACLAPNLTRLNLAGNFVREIGPVINFPSRLDECILYLFG